MSGDPAPCQTIRLPPKKDRPDTASSRCWTTSAVQIGTGLPRPVAAAKPLTLTRHGCRSSEVLRDKLFWLAGPGFLAPAFIATAIYFHHQHVEEIKGWPKGSFASAFWMLSIATISSKLLVGPVIDRVGSIRLIWTYHLPLGCSCLLLAFGSSPLIVYLAMVLIGVAMGGANSIFGTVWPELYGIANLGSIRLIAMSGIVFASACGSEVTGLLIDLEIGFETQLVSMAVWCALSTGSLFLISQRMHQRRGIERRQIKKPSRDGQVFEA